MRKAAIRSAVEANISEKGYGAGLASWRKPGWLSILLPSGKALHLHVPAGSKTTRERLEAELAKIPRKGHPATWRKPATFRAAIQLDIEAAI